ncbi:hypothetical protein ACFLYV_02110 [Chloroflexota bacterium]
MNVINKIQAHSSQWVFVAPIAGLTLTNDINNEINISRVTLVERNKLVRIRKRLGFDLTKDEFENRTIKNKHWGGVEANTFAIMKCRGVPKEMKRKCIDLLKYELFILASSQLGWGRRKNNSHPSLMGYQNMGNISYEFLDTKSKAGMYNNELTGKYMPLVLNGAWKRHHKQSFFFKLLKLIYGKPRKDSWSNTLERVAVMVGQSQCSNDLAQSFLWNMIAIEMLLSERGDTYIDVLPERVESILGWVGFWSVDDYSRKIREVYKKRCGFVHDGKINNISIPDLLFTDDILLNLLVNIVNNPQTFYSKQSVVDFADKVKAEHLLGRKSRVRPKSLQFTSRLYSEEDLLEI